MVAFSSLSTSSSGPYFSLPCPAASFRAGIEGHLRSKLIVANLIAEVEEETEDRMACAFRMLPRVAC